MLHTHTTRLERLSPAKRALLIEALRAEAAQRSAIRKIPPRAQKSPVVLSFAQQRLWFIDQLDPGNPAYNCPAAVALDGALDLGALLAAFNHLVARHESLRTTFASIDGLPHQVISAPTALSIPTHDLESLRPQEQEQEVAHMAAAEARARFDLGAGPLLRVTLLRLEERRHVLLLTLHHIVGDAWSVGVLVREIAQLYECFRDGRPSPLAELEVQYGDFAVWQREWLRGAELERQMSYWRRQLAGTRGLLELPVAKPRPALPSYDGAVAEIHLNAELTQQLRELSRGEGVTLFMTLLAAFKVLLYRYSGDEEVVVGTGVANRGRVETEGLIGFFVNMLVLRTELSGGGTFRELLWRVREVCLGAYAHQDVPFEKLVEELQPERGLGQTPLFQVVFVLQNAPVTLHFPGLTVKPLKVDFGLTHFDLTFSMEETEDELHGVLEYNTSLFDALTVAQLLKSYEAILKEVVVRADRRLLEIPLLPDDAARERAAPHGPSNEYGSDQFIF